MASAVGQDREFEQLKTLLFQAEATRLETLESDVARLQGYVGNPSRLEAATADVLVAALERAEIRQPRELANVIAPSVVSAVRSEIRNSREMMVDTLYPVVGRLVSAAVADAFRQLVAFLEERIGALTSAELWIGRLKSLVTGRPISEFVLADNHPLQINRLLIIERGNGHLVADWKREGIPDERADLMSAMVAAIFEFSIQALAEEGSLQKLDFGGREIVLRASPRFILAAECTGLLRPPDEARINSLFYDMIESMGRGSNCDAATLAALASSIKNDPLSRRKKRRRRGRILLLIFTAFAAALVAWLAGIIVARTVLEQRTNAALQRLVDEQPLLASFPLRLDFDHGDQRLTVSGIEPSQVDVPPLVNTLAEAAAPYRIVNRIGIVPGSEQSAALRTDIAAVQRSLSRLQASMDEMREAMAEESRSKDQQFAELREQYDRLASLVDSPAERLNRFMATAAVFFRTGTDEFTDSEEAERQLRQLATLLEKSDLKVRIVGYTDDTGSASANRRLALDRAQRVGEKLASLGVDSARLVIVSRSASMPIADRVGATNAANRRVTFENVFQTEPVQ
ncbi:OmpA family protein [Chelativorans sp. M5D2P16]|uniref:OmpA family protein n=1 Tax=Chelativorans sp. M5D2P16 TaxID=3095678 RepID=UPI002ACAC2E9|nr:OmpA family protein [Chelativorans sp. M5D2P16]MDZ5697442.1 OmpA family protein [Chelativorans sp. M5D2P16]